MEKVCLVIGAGAGIGGTVAKRFAKEGYHAYLARRTDEEGLNKLIKEISDAGGKASGSLLNVIEESSIEDLVNKIETDIGPISDSILLTKSSIEFSSITFSKEPDAFPPASEISFMSLLRPSSSVLRAKYAWYPSCLLYTSPSPRDRSLSRMPSSA